MNTVIKNVVNKIFFSLQCQYFLLETLPLLKREINLVNLRDLLLNHCVTLNCNKVARMTLSNHQCGCQRANNA